MDVGGGTGAFLIAAARRHPRLRLTLVDLPAVAAARRDRASPRRGSRRASPGRRPTFRTDALPPGADTISLVRVLYDHPDALVAALLARVAAALPPGGRVVVAEPMSGGAAPEPLRRRLFRASTPWPCGTGRVRSPAEIARAADRGRLHRRAEIPTRRPFLTGIVTARKSA